MKSVNIVKRLEKEGYSITFKKWAYWDNVPHVELEGFDFAIAETFYNNGWQGCNSDFIFNHVQEALYVAKKNNPIILKKIQKVPFEAWYYSQFLILNMIDYYRYEKGVYPFDEYYQILKKIQNEVD